MKEQLKKEIEQLESTIGLLKNDMLYHGKTVYGLDYYEEELKLKKRDLELVDSKESTVNQEWEAVRGLGELEFRSYVFNKLKELEEHTNGPHCSCMG